MLPTNISGFLFTKISLRTPPPTPVITPENTSKKVLSDTPLLIAAVIPVTVKMPRPIVSSMSIAVS